jgi:predicted acetyltransferase
MVSRRFAYLEQVNRETYNRFVAGHPEGPLTHIELIPAAPDQEPVVANLLELYSHDFSEFHEIELGADGKFGYISLPLYWREPNRRPFLIRVDGKLAGFVLAKRGSEVSGDETIWDMAEFFVVRRYRRRGIGTFVAHELWREIPGRWEIRVMESNRSAHLFWAHAISAFTGKTIVSGRAANGDKLWRVFAFESKPVPQTRFVG